MTNFDASLISTTLQTELYVGQRTADVQCDLIGLESWSLLCVRARVVTKKAYDMSYVPAKARATAGARQGAIVDLSEERLSGDSPLPGADS